MVITLAQAVRLLPSFVITITIAVRSQDVRGTDKKLLAIAVEVYANGGQRVTRRRTGEMLASNPEGYIFRREGSSLARPLAR